MTIAPEPTDSADALQRKLQLKFAVQRRKDMLVMQASQTPKAADKNGEVLKARSVPGSTKHTRAEKSEQSQKSEKAALSKATKAKKATKATKAKKATKATKAAESAKAAEATKVSKVSKQTKAKAREVQLNEIAEISTSTEPKAAEELSTSIGASAGESQKTLGAEGKETNDSDSKGKVLGEQMATAQKVHDILGILEHSKSRKDPVNPVKVARKAIPSLNVQKATEMIAYYSEQLLAHLKANPKETPESLQQMKVVHPISSDATED